MSSVSIPNRPAFRAQEVCEIAGVQPYVLRGWEAEFPDLGVTKTPNGPRIYRRADVERVLRLKHLILVDGLTLAGARRQLAEEAAPAVEESLDIPPGWPGADDAARGHLRQVQEGLQWILKTLDGRAAPPGEFMLATDAPPAPLPAKTAKSGKKVAKKSDDRQL